MKSLWIALALSSVALTYADYMKFGDPNTTNPVIGPIAPGQ